MKRIFSLIILAAFASTSLLVSFVTDAEAIPAFARKEGAECTLCHVGFPKLNSFGYGYKQRGYRMEDTDGIWVWESPVQFAGMAAIGFMYMDMDRAGTMQDVKEAKITLGELEFFTGGNLAPKVSYFVDFELESASTGGEDQGVAVGGMFVILDDVLPDSLLNIKVGAYDSSWYWLAGARKLGMTGYLATDAGTNNTQGFGFDGLGVEVNGILATDTRYQIGIGNDGTDANDGALPAAITSLNTSTDFSLKQYYVVLDQMFEFGGAEQRIGFTWVSNRIGADSDNNTAPFTDTTDRTNLWGASVDLNIPIGEQPLNLIFAYFSFDDSNTVGTADYNTWLVEAILPIGDKIVLEALYENYDLDKNQLTAMALGDPMRSVDSERWAISGHYFFAPNVDLIFDYSHTSIERQMVMAPMGMPMTMPAGDMDMDMDMVMFHLGF